VKTGAKLVTAVRVFVNPVVYSAQGAFPLLRTLPVEAFQHEIIPVRGNDRLGQVHSAVLALPANVQTCRRCLDR
jgi:hypothetical protein